MTDFEWMAVGLDEVAWIALAFVLGLLARVGGLPPLIGYLAAGFLLGPQSAGQNELVEKLSDLGITLLLFTVGLKIHRRTLVRPQVWAISGLHMVVVLVSFTGIAQLAALAGASLFAGLELSTSLGLAFALSFSSTVFAVKVLEERGEMNSLQGQIAIGILIMQDLAAVLFLAASTGKLPSVYALLLILLVPARRFLHRLLERVGHGELMVLYGFLLALGGAELFELVEMKGDLGALVVGTLVASHPKAEELAKVMLGFKDLFLIGFFLSIGFASSVTVETLLLGLGLAPLVLLKAALFFALFTRFRLRARTSLLASVYLSSYSEFGLIVAAIGVESGWLDPAWLVALAIALSVSFAVATALDKSTYGLYSRRRDFWRRWQSSTRLPDDRLLDIGGAQIAIVGMGSVGTGAYEEVVAHTARPVVGIDIDPITVRDHARVGRNVMLGDPGDADFWDRVQASETLELVLLTLPKLSTNLRVLKRLEDIDFSGRIAVTSRFADQERGLELAGAHLVYDMHRDAGAGFAAHVLTEVEG
ncbi:MAG: cation:proton antiporter [Acidobacteriota bacterium]